LIILVLSQEGRPSCDSAEIIITNRKPLKKENEMKEIPELNQEQKILKEVIKLYMDAERLVSIAEEPEFISLHQNKRSAYLNAVAAVRRASDMSTEEADVCWYTAKLEVFGYIR
jgi:hypothetical protein